jgi:nucleoside-diphosphate-sugar epimerase
MTTRVLITGATGFVGANLARYLAARPDYQIHILIRKTPNLWRINDLIRSFRIHYADLQELEELAAIIKAVQPDIVYHVAAYGGFTVHETDQTRMIQTNLLATMRLVDAAVREKVPYFIHTGSSSEYGTKDAPMREDDVCRPVNFYGITKLAATNYCSMVGETSSTRICTLRLFSVYGEWEDSSRLYPSIVKALEKGERAKLSRPQSVRDFIPVGQVVEWYEKIVRLPFRAGDIINIGSGKQQTIQQFYNRIARQMNKEHIRPIWGAALPRAHEPKVWQADVTKLNELLGHLREGDEA